jgi:hypothetical protein
MKRGKWDIPWSIEDVVGTEWDDMSARKDEMRAAFHQPAHVEVVRVEK